MSDDPSATYVYEFRVRSLDKTQPVSKIINDIIRLASGMPNELSEYGSGLQVKVRREETIPIDPLTVIVVLEIANLTLKPMLEGFFHKLGEKMADYLSDGVDNAQIVLEKEPSEAQKTRTTDEQSGA